MASNHLFKEPEDWYTNTDKNYIKNRIKQLEEENQKLKEMIRAIPCTCDEAYKSRGLTAPDCPRCNYVDENGEFQVVADAGKYFGIDKE